MTQAIIPIIAELEAILSAENSALSAVDYAAVGALVDRKRATIEALMALDREITHQGPAEATAARLDPALEERLGGLRDLARQNRRLLERALAVQSRVLGSVLRAVPVLLVPGPGYGASGSPAAAGRAAPIALSARA